MILSDFNLIISICYYSPVLLLKDNVFPSSTDTCKGQTTPNQQKCGVKLDYCCTLVTVKEELEGNTGRIMSGNHKDGHFGPKLNDPESRQSPAIVTGLYLASKILRETHHPLRKPIVAMNE